ncbi:MAG: hypothetical protein IKL68_04275 [Clostridia bacterium]|nr:hypothetical protein [Clostridia bacterium]
MQESVGNLSLKEKIGQMFIVGVDGTETNADIIELIQAYKIGGVFLDGKNIESVKQLQKLINDLKAANIGNSLPLFIAIAEETGRGNVLPNEIRTIPAMKYIIENTDKTVVYDATNITANILAKLGVNMNFAPLLDMGGMVNGIPLGDRCISENNTTLIAGTAVQVVNAHRNNGIIPVPKYFPGHATTKAERSNLVIPYTKKSLAKLEQQDIAPFKYLIEEGIETMLVGHIQVSKVNMFTPASLSHKMIEKTLKAKYNFEGLSITDDLASIPITVQYGLKSAVHKAILAGNELMIVSSASKMKSVLDDLEKQISKGNIDNKVIDNRVQKVVDLKVKYNLNDNEMPELNIDVENERIEELIKRIRQI